MSASTHDSTACCTTPVTSEPPTSIYAPKGDYVVHANTNCYIAGSTSAKKAVFFIYDVFGFRNPTLRGADVLASAGYLVIIPDLFDGEPAEPEWLPPDSEEKKAKFGAFMARARDAPTHVDRIHRLLVTLKQAYPRVESWASIGFCWGGKLVSLTSGAGTPWAVGVQSSPARVDPEDAKKVEIPMMMLASKDEPSDAIEGFQKELRGEKMVRTFDGMMHGWMSARADLDSEEGRKGFESGYNMVLEFLDKYL